MISPLLGAGLLAWAGPVQVVLLDAGTFVAAAAAVAALRVREPALAPAAAHWRADAALAIAVTLPQTASIALSAALVAVVDYRLLLAVMAAVLVISVVYLMGGPGAVAPAVAPVPLRDGGA